MRRSGFGLALIALAALSAGGCGPTATGTPVANAAGVWIEVSPGTISAGSTIALRADCGDNSNVASVTSAAFGTLTLHPWNSLLSAQTNVPGTTAPATYDVRLVCATGSKADTTLTVLGNAASVPKSQGPATGGGYLAQRSWWQTARDTVIGPAGWLTAAAAVLITAGMVLTLRRRPSPPR